MKRIKAQGGEDRPRMLTRIGELDRDDLGSTVEVDGNGYTVRGVLTYIDVPTPPHAYYGVDEKWDMLHGPSRIHIVCGNESIEILGLPVMHEIRFYDPKEQPVENWDVSDEERRVYRAAHKFFTEDKS